MSLFDYLLRIFETFPFPYVSQCIPIFIYKNEISKQFVGKHTFNAVSLGNNVVLITFLGIFVLNQGNEMNLYIFSFNQTLV